MKFIDEAIIEVKSGDGAPGAVHFRREKYKPRCGPDGGSGGAGGDLYFMASTSLQSLLDFKFTPKYEAADGEKGTGNDCDGKGGKDLLIQVPQGTALYDADTGALIADLVVNDEKILLLKGGRGGLGNMYFATPTRQAPDFAQPGEPGVKRRIRLELKLLADVALIGFPNAGKSTLISKWSAAKPKIADYPFTTLVPNLGVVRTQALDFVVADIPGLIEGASEGRGLGTTFLKHAERTRLLLVMLDLSPFTARNLSDELNVLMTEMANFSQELATRPKILALNKVDMVVQESDKSDLTMENLLTSPDLADKGLEDLLNVEIKKWGFTEQPFLMSGASGMGLDELKVRVTEGLQILGPRILENRVDAQATLGNMGFFSEKNFFEGEAEDLAMLESGDDLEAEELTD